MVKFTTHVAAMIIAFAALSEALSANLSTQGQAKSDVATHDFPNVDYESRMLKLRVPSSTGTIGDANMDLLPRQPESKTDVDAFGIRGFPGPRRLPSSAMGSSLLYRRGRHRKHCKHGKHHRHGKHPKDHSRGAEPPAAKALNGTMTAEGSPSSTVAPTPVPTPTVARRDVYMVIGQGDHGHLSVKSVSETEDHQFLSRGLLDDVIPIVGMIPGLEGIIKLVPELLNGALGPELGGLILSPNKESYSASNSKNESHYMLAATTKDPSAIWLVDEGELTLSPTQSISASSDNSTAGQRVVSLQMAFVDPASGGYRAYCATYEEDSTRPVSLGVVPCLEESPLESQKFAYDPETSILRAIWSKERSDNLPPVKRQIMIGGSKGDAQAEGTGSTVVMVFQPANSTTPQTMSPHDLMSQSMRAAAENTTIPRFHSHSIPAMFSSNFTIPVSDPSSSMTDPTESMSNSTADPYSRDSDGELTAKDNSSLPSQLVPTEPHSALDTFGTGTSTAGAVMVTSVPGERLGADVVDRADHDNRIILGQP